MKLPRNLNGVELAKLLVRFGYEPIGQRGSHLYLATELHGRQRITIPAHRPIKPGTLAAILRQVADHHGMTRDELIERLGL